MNGTSQLRPCIARYRRVSRSAARQSGSRWSMQSGRQREPQSNMPGTTSGGATTRFRTSVGSGSEERTRAKRWCRASRDARPALLGLARIECRRGAFRFWSFWDAGFGEDDSSTSPRVAKFPENLAPEGWTTHLTSSGTGLSRNALAHAEHSRLDDERSGRRSFCGRDSAVARAQVSGVSYQQSDWRRSEATWWARPSACAQLQRTRAARGCARARPRCLSRRWASPRRGR